MRKSGDMQVLESTSGSLPQDLSSINNNEIDSSICCLHRRFSRQWFVCFFVCLIIFGNIVANMFALNELNSDLDALRLSEHALNYSVHL